MKKKELILFMAIFCVLALIVGGTYAYWQWESANTQNPAVIFNTIKGIDKYVYYDAGESHFVGNFQPSSNHCGGQSSTISFYIKNGTQYNVSEHGKLYATIMMDINAIDSVIAQSSAVKWAVTQGSNSDCGTVLAEGNFSGKISGDSFQLFKNLEILNQSVCLNGNTISSNCKYTVWLWIDSNGSDLSSLSGRTINVNIWSQIDMGMSDADEVKPAGVYDAEGNFTSWDELVANGHITVENGVITASNSYDGNMELVLGGELVIPNTVTTIGDYVFEMNDHITSVMMSDSITTIGDYAFNSTSITDVYYEGTEEQWAAIDIGYGNDKLINATIHYNYTGEES